MERSFVESRYLQQENIIALVQIEKQTHFTAQNDGFDALVLVITESEPASRLRYTHHYIKEGRYIQERWYDRSFFEEMLHSANFHDVHQWVLTGEIILDVTGFLQQSKEWLQQMSAEKQKLRLFEEFAFFLRHYLHSRDYLTNGDIMDAHSHILQAVHHWANLSIIEQGQVPETAIWKQVRNVNPGIYKLYEELIMSQETLEQQIRLAHLACDFSIASKLKDCCKPLLQILSSRTEPWSAAELENHPDLQSVRRELNLLLKKLISKSLIREVFVSTDVDLDLLELRYIY